MDIKDYATVDVAVHIHSAAEVNWLYNDFTSLGWDYKQDTGGPLITIGHIDGRPICIAPLIHEINSVRVLYVEATSALVDWTMIDSWVAARIRRGASIVSDPVNLHGHINQILEQ